MADVLYSEEEVLARLQEFVDEIVPEVLKETSDVPPRQIAQDSLPYAFFLPGRATYRKGRGAGFWITDRTYRCLLLAGTATKDNDRVAARNATAIIAALKHKFMSVERLLMDDGKAFNITPQSDSGLSPDRKNEQLRYVAEFALLVSYEEYIANTGM